MAAAETLWLRILLYSSCLCIMLAVSEFPTEFDNVIPNSMLRSRGKRSIIKKSSLIGGALQMVCDRPAPPRRASLQCRTSTRKTACTAICMEGYVFPDGTTVQKHECSNFDGIWKPAPRFEDCSATCNPSCENGGRCLEANYCMCTPKFRGPRCEYPLDNCHAGKLGFAGNWGCNHTSEISICTISCPNGMKFDYPPEAEYRCNLQGVWTPSSAPKCILENVYLHPEIIAGSSPEYTFTSLSNLKTKSAKSATCYIWGHHHFRTFDGAVYSFDGKCTYLLVKDNEYSSFVVHIRSDPECTGPSSCNRQIIIYIDKNVYVIKKLEDKLKVYVDEAEIKVPSVNGRLLLEKIGNALLVDSGLGFKLRWDGELIAVEASPEMRNRTDGLCGFYNGNPSDDFRQANGKISYMESFVNSWRMNEFEENCPDAKKLENRCKYNDVFSKYKSNKAEAACTFDTPAYAQCAEIVDRNEYLDACKFDYCTCKYDNYDCICNTAAAYFKECNRLGGRIRGGWRNPDFCPMVCPESMVYSECGSSCKKTCKNTANDCTNNDCVDGCHCPPGTVFHEDRCVQPEECPCYHGGMLYKNGQKIRQDCNVCECRSAKWQCTQEQCGARCFAVGDPHYQTFDGRHYDFMGQCSYYLMYHHNYSIEQENVACSGAISESLGFFRAGNGLPSCTKSVTIRIRDTVLRLKQGQETSINGKDIGQLPASAPGVHVYIASSVFLKVDLENGLSVTWDGESRVYIDAPASFMTKTRGLCGTFTNNQKDDFLTAAGDIEQDVNAFANKWKTQDSCTDLEAGQVLRDPCELYSQHKAASEEHCGKLKSSIFKECHDIVDVEPYYKDCMYDTCYCQSKIKNCLCPALSNYATACAKKAVHIDWRSNVRECGMNCLSGQVYHVCSSSCTRSCADISSYTTCKRDCVEGCNCPTGMTLNNVGDCIPIAQCPCILDEKEYLAGFISRRNGEICECFNAVWNCRIATSDELTLEGSEETENTSCSSAANKEHSDCVSKCSITCRSMHSPPKCDDTTCKPGCACKKGYVLDEKSSRCVKPTQCPCHHGGRSYNEFEMMQEDCNTCVCEGGAWNCETKECAGYCISWGDSHFRTFDGRTYEFHGDCDYTLVKGGEEKYSTFAVTIHNVPCGTSDVTCSKSVNILVGEEKFTLTADKSYLKGTVGTRFLVRQVGLYVFVHTDIGITLQWDKGTGVHVRASTKWKDRMEGLCGNFNGNELDDFRTSDGGPPVVRATLFGDSWRVQDYCPQSKAINNTCDLHPHRKSWATRQCSVLKSDVFRPCHTEVSYQPFLERCIFDTCACDIGGDCNCLCTALATYAQECNLNGIPIHWRSQELCPIQCEECAKYSPCMSVCPPKTCDTQYLYSSLEATCGSEPCVEGCEPKACGPDEIFNNDREFKCIPKSACIIQPCKLLNGIMYHEGERVDDPSLGDKCQSCYCRKGEFECSGKPCQTERPTPTPTIIYTTTTPSIQIPACYKDGWTEWMSSFTPTYKNGGDYETFEMLRKRLFTFCPLDNMTSIECQTVATHEHYKSTGQNVWCSLPEGLICENRDQPGTKLCYNYEIRVRCQCAPKIESTTIQPVPTKTTTLPPILQCNTGWTNWMNSRKPDNNGDAELLPELRKQYKFCTDEDIDFVKCRTADGVPTQNVECTKDIGLVCRNTPDQTCNDYEIRFYCNCDVFACSAPVGMEAGSILDRHIAVSSFRTFDNLGSKARLNGAGAWSPATPVNQWIQIKLPEVQDISGVLTQGNPNAPEWVTYYEVQVSDDGNNWKYVQSPELTNLLLTGNSDQNTIATNTFPNPVTARFIRIKPMQWEKWPSLRLELLGCNTNLPTTQTTLTTSATPTFFPPTCKQGYTEWMNIDSPDQMHSYEKGSLPRIKPGDNELASQLHYFYEFCSHPTAAECRNAANGLSAHLTNEKVTCDTDGLTCNNDDQVGGRCQDYEIRFFCQCEETTTPLTITETPTTTPTPTAIPPVLCDRHGWTDWMNSNHPEKNSEGDMESLSSLRKYYTFCADDYVKDIQCRTADTKMSFDTVGQYGVVCDVNHGLQCSHSSQRNGVCKDYEVQVFCLCNVTTVTATTPTTTITTEAPITAAPPVKKICNGWTSWLNTDSPQDDGIDNELIWTIPNFNEICEKPVSIQCRDAESKQMHYNVGQNLKERCTKSGLSCESIGQTCKDYEIRAYCLCPTQPTTPASCTSGWTEWFDTDDPNDDEGDFEQVDELRKQFEFCDTDNILEVECKSRSYSVGLKKPANRGGIKSGGSSAKKSIGYAKGGESEDLIDYKETGDVGVKCSTLTGLSCYNKLQPRNRICRNYRVRFYCKCGDEGVGGGVSPPNTPTSTPTTPTTQIVTSPKVCGWTSWLNADNPSDKSTGDGDYETITRLQAKYGICDKSEISKIECRLPVVHTPWNTAGQLNVSCDTEYGLQCNNKLQIDGCYDYEVRVECIYDWCPTTIPPTTPTTIIASTPPCPPYVQWNDCAYNCSRMCHSFLRASQSMGLCETENPSKCIPGCVFEECLAHEFQRDERNCVLDSDCTCITDNGVTLAPGETIYIDNCTQCQCVSNTIHCSITCGEPAATLPPSENIVREDCWTEWINGDSPNEQKGDLGDKEEIRAIRTKFSLCAQPTVIECRVAGTNISIESARQRVECDLIKGLVCWNSYNLPNGCFDYEIRLYCPDCKITTTQSWQTETQTIQPTETTKLTQPTPTVGECISGFTEWMSADTPDYKGENENIQSLRAAGYVFCSTDKITAIECRTVADKVIHSSSRDIGLVCEIYEGLQCDSKRQPKGRKCRDYEVRFYCDCGFTETTPTETTEVTYSVPTSGFTTTLPPCDYWSNWLNNDNPMAGIGDVELLPLKSRACNYGFITHVECAEAENGRPYNSTGEHGLACNSRIGFSCLNRKQPDRKCLDYKIRYFCSCTELTSTVPTSTTEATTTEATTEATTTEATTEATTITTTIGIIPFVPDESGVHCTKFIKDYMSRLSDSAFRASSSQSIQRGPHQANMLSDSAWSPAEQTDKEYIELDIYRPQLVFGIVTKGHPTENSWVLKYRVMFSNDGKLYSYHHHQDIISVFPGNMDGDTPAYRVFPQPVTARYIRIIPQEWNGQIALRVEPMLCEEGAVEYSTATTPPSTSIYTTSASTWYTTIEPRCEDFMGIQDGNLSDSQITASSYLNNDLAPHKGRLNGYTAWVPEIANDQQYLQFDFLDSRALTGIVSEGRNSVSQWVTSYNVQYSNDEINWNYILDYNHQPQTYQGNYDNVKPVTNYFERPIRTRYLRIIPKTWHNWIAMRIEIKGCYEAYPTSTTTSTTTTTEAATTEETITKPEEPCNDFMGIQDGNLSDSQITASSYLNNDLAPHKGRLNGYTAWVPEIANDQQYLQFDFHDARTLTGIVSEGRNSVSQWVSSYNVQYSNDEINWTYILDFSNEPQTFQGNDDNLKPVTNYFERSIRTRYLRIIPKTWHNWIAMRVEIKGCYEAYPTTTTTTEAATTTATKTTEATATTATPVAHITVPPAPECSEPMGIASGKIRPEQMRVTSSLAGERSGPKRIAIGTKEGFDTGGWIAKSNSRNEYVEIDFKELVQITGLTTQGRDKHPEWVKSYKVMHSADNLIWKYATGPDGKEVINGNYDNGTPVTRHFLSPVTAQYIRIFPYQWKDHISMRLEVLGCHVKEKCIKYSDWISNSFPKLSSPDDVETVHDAIQAYFHEGGCTSPVIIECRSLVYKKPYNQMGQNVSCDLKNGLVCRQEDQHPNAVCKDYEIRVGCWACPTSSTTSPPPPIVCPEVPAEMIPLCPQTCSLNFNCDGSKCVEYHNCSCFQDGRKYYPGETMENANCHICTCTINGHSYCVNKTCASCPEGHEADLDENCQCKCKTCPPGEKLCPTSKQCILESQWCNGETDCPDDELYCPTTELPTTFTKPPSEEPESLTREADCDITGSYIETFDGQVLHYEICNHVLFTDREHDNFYIIISKVCPLENNNTKCHKMYTIKHHDLKFSIYNGQVYDNGDNEIPHQALPLIEKRFQEISIRKVGNAIIFKSIQHHFALTVEGYGYARIDVKNALSGHVYGLCGFYNNNGTDDFQLKDGTTVVANGQEFGDNWAHSNSESCSEQKCDSDDLQNALKLCNALSNAPFDACHKEVKQPNAIAKCVNSICECLMVTNNTEKQCQCDAFTAYAEECERQRGSDIPYWRSRTGCHSSCPPNLEWKDCGPSCEPTCEDIKQNQSSSCDHKKCVAGCFCPDGLFRKGDKCVEATKCCDCVCKGYGDPHYYGFDGKYFPFQGNCTYVLARPKSEHPQQKNFSFEVYATNEDCFEEPMTTCTVAIMVLYQGHYAYFRINESVTFDGVQLYPHHYPLESDGIHIESIPGRSVTFTIPEVFLEVRYFELNYGFEVRLPSEVYFNQTEGLCGNCNHDPDDDIRIKDGVVTNDTDDFGFSWLAVPPEGMESTNDVCKIKEPIDCKPGADLLLHRCQELVQNLQFAPCIYVIDPQPLIKSCEFDVCHSENPTHSVCRALTEYARRCATAGICIQDWRSAELCDYQCADGMYFDQCGSACPTRCTHIVDATPKPDYCENAPVDGCVCTGGKVFNEVGLCVDPRDCATCDEEGHKTGETWYPDPCTTCKCNTEKSIECLRQKCPDKPICRPKEYLQTNYATNVTCCNKYTCVPEPVPTCPEVNPQQCNTSEVLKQTVDDKQCPVFTCECDPFLCPPQRYIELEVGEEVLIQQEGCCNISKPTCNSNKCPKAPKCPKDYTLHEKEISRYKCCQEFECLPPPNTCFYYHEFEVVDGKEEKSNQLTIHPTMYQNGESWTDGLCKKCTCDGKKGYQCASIICQKTDHNSDQNDYVLVTEHIANECCPQVIRTKCKYEDQNYTAGDKWNSTTDKCKHYSCEKSPDGVLHKTELTTQCNTDCALGSKYVEPSEGSPECCGKCQTTSCVEDGVIYEVGQTWNSSTRLCYSADCQKPNDQTQVLYTKLPCPQMPENCLKKMQDESGCCEVCTEPPLPQTIEPCTAKNMQPEETIGLFELFVANTRCSNKKEIPDLKFCSGGCDSHSIYSSVEHDFASICNCCTPIKSDKKMIYLDCADGIQRPIDYYQPTTCDCTTCKGSEKESEKLVLPDARQK